MPNAALVKPSSAGTGMCLLLDEASRGSLPFKSLYSQLSAPLSWVPSPFHCTPSKKDSGPLIAPSMSSRPAWGFAYPLRASCCLFFEVHQTHVPVQVREHHPGSRAARQRVAGAWCGIPTCPSSVRPAVRCLSGRAVANTRLCLLSSVRSPFHLWD